ncbi:hypothetical protein G6F31_014974 [Rhizopus arrhizus]|nr:hypothetical protein G6F31_014974 [Rhizopus arrhizus]
MHSIHAWRGSAAHGLVAGFAASGGVRAGHDLWPWGHASHRPSIGKFSAVGRCPMKTRALAMSLLFALAATPALALAQAAPPTNAAAPGLLRIDVDARDLARRIFKVTATVPAKPGPMTLLYPQWIPGNHSPTGPIDKLAGLRVTANGKPLAWQRDQFNVYAFKPGPGGDDPGNAQPAVERQFAVSGGRRCAPAAGAGQRDPAQGLVVRHRAGNRAP